MGDIRSVVNYLLVPGSEPWSVPSSPGTTVTGAAAVDLATVGQSDKAAIGEVGAILGAITLDDDLATDFEVPSRFHPRRLSAPGLAPSTPQLVTLPWSSTTSM